LIDLECSSLLTFPFLTWLLGSPPLPLYTVAHLRMTALLHSLLVGRVAKNFLKYTLHCILLVLFKLQQRIFLHSGCCVLPIQIIASSLPYSAATCNVICRIPGNSYFMKLVLCFSKCLDFSPWLLSVLFLMSTTLNIYQSQFPDFDYNRTPSL
jgi:hypothetical protein